MRDPGGGVEWFVGYLTQGAVEVRVEDAGGAGVGAEEDQRVG